MDWTEALKALGEGGSVYREDWPWQEYVDSRFSPIKGLPDPGYPYMDSNGGQFKLVKVTETATGQQEEPYEPSEEDRAATDWMD